MWRLFARHANVILTQAIRSRKFLVLNERGDVWKIGWGQNMRLADTVPDSDCFVSLRKR